MHFWYYGSPVEKATFRKECQKYLLEMYNENMTIIDVEYSFKTRDYFADISLDNTGIKFRAVKGKNGISDSFFVEFWKYETSKDITDFVTSIYGENKGTGELYFTQGSPISNSVYKLENKVPSFLSVRDKFTDSIFGFVDIALKFDSEDCLNEYKKIYRVIEYVFEKYLPNNIVASFLDGTQFKISIEEFKRLQNEADISHLGTYICLE